MNILTNPDAGEILPYEKAIYTQKHYCCSRCYGQLGAYKIPGDTSHLRVMCWNPNCDGSGFVTKKYAEAQRQQSAGNYAEALWNLADILPTQTTPEQALKDLGF